jgi:superfamily II DNA or RNA helicase
MELRDYQQQTIDQLRQALQAGKKRPVVQAPTGAGKTIIAAAIVNMARKRGKKVIFAVPFLSLINQTVERFFQNSIFEVGVMQGDHGMTNPNMPVQVCSVQTLARRNIPKADLVIVDECHNMFKLYDQWMNDPDWKDVPFIGLTATPWAKGMGKAGRWDDLIVCTTTADLIAKKTLSDFRVFAPAHPDLSGVQIVAGDYKIDQLASVMDRATLVADIIKTWLQRANGRPTVAFCVDRTHAKHVENTTRHCIQHSGALLHFALKRIKGCIHRGKNAFLKSPAYVFANLLKLLGWRAHAKRCLRCFN